MSIDKESHQREAFTEWPIRPALTSETKQSQSEENWIGMQFVT